MAISYVLQEPDLRWLAPETHILLTDTIQEADRSGVKEVSLSFFIMSMLQHRDEKMARLLRLLHIDIDSIMSFLEKRATRASLQEDDSIAAVIPIYYKAGQVPLTHRTASCLERAILAAQQLGIPRVTPAHLLISMWGSTHAGFNFAFRVETITKQLKEHEEWLELIPFLDACIKQSACSYSQARDIAKVLRAQNHTDVSFKDIEYLRGSARKLISLIRKTEQNYEVQEILQVERHVPVEVLLKGFSLSDSRIMAEAVAARMGTPLSTLSLSGLVLLCSAFSFSIYTPMELSEKGGFALHSKCLTLHGLLLLQHTLKLCFYQAGLKSPCVVLIEQLDTLGYLASSALRETLLTLLFALLEQLSGPKIWLIASAQQSAVFESLLRHMQSRHFHKVIDAEEIAKEELGQQRERQRLEELGQKVREEKRFCASCLRLVPKEWKHCMYCGASLSKVCPQCGTAQPEVEGLRFCFSCGSSLE